MATSDPRTLPKASTWYLITTLPLPGTRRAAQHPALPAADLREVVRLYGLRQWVEQGDKQVKQELGWADFPVRSDRAIRRHWALVCCAFAFCWWAESHRARADATAAPLASDAARSRSRSLPRPQVPGAGEKWSPRATGGLTDRAQRLLAAAVVATGAAAGAGLA